MELKELQKNWDDFGKTDPLWAILTDPSKKDNRWNLEEFFSTGRDEIAVVMDYLRTLNVTIPSARALDFGCGVGRLSQALCDYFKRCDGVDIAPSMIDHARQYNRFGDRCHYHVNGASDLSLFPDNSFDFIYSNIVLQHMQPKYSARYIEEFIRILTPGGLVVFQIPAEVARNTPLAPLPESMFNAKIAVAPDALSAVVGAKISLAAKVTNLGKEPWRAAGPAHTRYQIRLGNHWLTTTGDMVQVDDARAEIPHDLSPGEEVELHLRVTAPERAGDYILELDMVQEHVAWFKQKGSRPTHIAVKVTSATGEPAAAQPASTPQTGSSKNESEPRMEMYCTPKETVIETVKRQGGRLVDVQEYGSAGPQFVGYRYCATK